MYAGPTQVFASSQNPLLLAHDCCNELHAALPGRVYFPESAEYVTQSRSYYAAQQIELRPACRVSPSSTDEVSRIVALAAKRRCQYAVRSGGHMSWEGGSNIDDHGFTMDLGGLRHLILSGNREIVSVGPGLRWGEVYHALLPHNLTAAGGRSSDVGIGGFLLGGGISFLSLEHGFGSDNVKEYEVVLTNGSVVLANKSTRSDLFWALKGGSTNFGIVTRFDLVTFPTVGAWGGGLFFDIGKGPELLRTYTAYTHDLDHDPLGFMCLSFAWDPKARAYAVWAPVAYLKPEAFPPLFGDLKGHAPFHDTTRLTSIAEITDEIEAMAPGGGRTLWFTMTFGADASLVWKIFEMGKEAYAGVLDRPGTSWALMLQPMNKQMMVASRGKGGNPFGFKEDDDQFLILVLVFWDDSQDDEVVRMALRAHRDMAAKAARQRGLLHPWIYPNYASKDQDVLQGFGGANVEMMRAIQREYDPVGLGSNWRGGFKL
ncbi:hypothetical protein HGRIS_014378 [Hohenbuehelia grisea]|uniref:FAD-binding PCMH-type domain-containing protein n=1 Tax=Hohenbuehelia grisea TaxID=104357 RepID=A0ABR3JTW2_9AGAR